MSTAIVAGATGILGREIVNRLGQNPQRWKKVYALSRSKKETMPSNAQQLHIDILAGVDEMAKQLQHVVAEYVFFAAYLAQDSAEADWKVNGDLLQNFLDALLKSGAANGIKRVVLVTGAKQYGVHLGPTKLPMLESDPWLRDTKLFPPNFYYRQQDILVSFCEKSNGNTSWNVTYPNDVIGFAQGNAMNLASALGIYAAVEKELGHDLKFPGSKKFYTLFDTFTSAALHAKFCEWVVLEPTAANQAFNVVNGDTESWQNLWPRVAKHFGMKVDQNQFIGEPVSSLEMTPKPPLATLEAIAGLKGIVERGSLEQRVDLVQWSQGDDVKKAWDALASREGLDKSGLEKGTWSFLSNTLGRSYSLVSSMSKARALGWTGYEDTWQSLERIFGDLAAERIIPRKK